jgi:hypothetical protein
VSKGTNVTSASANHGKLPSKPKINSEGERKAITSRDELSDLEFPDMQEVKRTLRSGTSYQGSSMPTEEETKIMSELSEL